jgi:hypothetical protein
MTKMLKTSAEGRRCEFPNCDRILSIYNHQKYCHLHLSMLSEEEKIRNSIHSGLTTELHHK